VIKVLIVDDQSIIRDGLKFIIERDPEIKVAGCAGNGQEALELCGRLLPDIILMDIVMPVCDGIEAMKLIKRKYPSIKVIILTTFFDESNISLALTNGADGYVLKDVESEELMFAIKGTLKGLRVFHENVLGAVIKQTQIEDEIPLIKNRLGNLELTDKENEILKLIVFGKSNKEIATSLKVSEGGIRNSISVMLTKLKLKDRTQLAVFAIKNGLV
jgi:DNA-binding NarL/FixJ family response regulator